jgi:hypothetical protein
MNGMGIGGMGGGRLLVEEECRSGRGVVVGEERWWERRGGGRGDCAWWLEWK